MNTNLSYKGVSLFVLFLVAVAVVAFVGSNLGERGADPSVQADLDDDAMDQLARNDAVSQIAAESESIDAGGADTPDASVQPGHATAPPGFVPAPPTIPEATPPEGYSFTAYHEVERGPMTAADLDPDHPRADPPAWMASGEGGLADQAAAAGRDWSFGWVKLADGADLAGLGDLLAAHGGEVLGRTGDLVRARLPGDPSSLQAIARSGSVAGLGAFPAGRKITDTLAERAATNLGDDVPVWITLMSDDPDQRWRSALKDLGAQVGLFDPAIRTYAATIPLTALGRIAEADFVAAVESIGRVETTLEIAAPAMGADALRSYDAGMETFVGVGGASVPVGIMDTGFNIDHPDLSSNRRSICGANFANQFNPREEDQDLWWDRGEHGSHVAGIVFGNGADVRARAGIAPMVQDVRIAKAAGSRGSASALGWNRAMDWFARPTACGGDATARKALVINSSLGALADVWEGRSVVERKIDASVWASRQLFVTSAGNTTAFGALRIVGASSMAVAKNALSVGATQNIGDIAAFSSQGPTYDGRLLPKIVGTGVAVASARGRGQTWGYNIFSGTSMSSPSVVGVAALVMDAVPELKEEPAALAARLMASAVKHDVFLGDPDAFPYDNTNGPGTFNNAYGLGKVSARTAVLNRDTEDGWFGGSAAFEVDASGHAYHDIVVPEGASRLDVVMTWNEPPAASIADSVLHDLDLWVDRGASCGDIAACGYYSSRSRIDNVEWVIVQDPPAGVYRLKVVPNRIYGTAPRAGLAWTVIRGDSSPTLAVAADKDHVEVGPDVPFEVEVTVSSDAYVATGANVRVECRTEVGSAACDELSYTPDESMVHREDGLERTLVRDGFSIAVGEIGPDDERTVTLGFAGQSEGSFRLHVTVSGWNAESGETSVAVVVGDAEMPPPVQRPPNDDFAMAIELDAMGETTFDIAAATPDPGEPAFSLVSYPQRARSLWYVWTAPETGLARFSVAQSVPGDHSDYVVVDIFHDGPMSSLKAVGNGQLGGGKTFFAEAGETYRIRLGTLAEYLADRRSILPDLTLTWGPGSRPANDDYAHAAAIGGESGTLSGTSQGATSEPEELMGGSDPETPVEVNGWAASVWYRWTAPSTGDFEFSTNRTSQVVAAFVGDSVADARMVSGVPARGGDFGEAIVFPATEGVEYRIAVATASAYWSGNEFELSWGSGERANPRNDDFADASRASGNFASGTVAFNAMTVEHGEPAASGVRTVWWTWRATEDGRYTWLADRRAGFLRDEAPLQMSVFAGDELATLELVAMDEGTDTQELQLAFDTKADTAYHVALGLPRDAAQVRLPSARIIMQWGPTPENDDLANATALPGMSGTLTGSNQFRHERALRAHRLARRLVAVVDAGPRGGRLGPVRAGRSARVEARDLPGRRRRRTGTAPGQPGSRGVRGDGSRRGGRTLRHPPRHVLLRQRDRCSRRQPGQLHAQMGPDGCAGHAALPRQDRQRADGRRRLGDRLRGSRRPGVQRRRDRALRGIPQRHRGLRTQYGLRNALADSDARGLSGLRFRHAGDLGRVRRSPARGLVRRVAQVHPRGGRRDRARREHRGRPLPGRRRARRGGLRAPRDGAVPDRDVPVQRGSRCAPLLGRQHDPRHRAGRDDRRRREHLRHRRGRGRREQAVRGGTGCGGRFAQHLLDHRGGQSHGPRRGERGRGAPGRAGDGRAQLAPFPVGGIPGGRHDRVRPGRPGEPRVPGTPGGARFRIPPVRGFAGPTARPGGGRRLPERVLRRAGRRRRRRVRLGPVPRRRPRRHRLVRQSGALEQQRGVDRRQSRRSPPLRGGELL